MADELQNARNEIDKIDSELVRLFERRLTCAMQIAQYKRTHGLAVENTEREASVLNSASNEIENGEYREYVLDFLKKAISISKTVQERKKNIYITGMPYSGKTLLAKRLIESTDYVVVDTDDLVVDSAEMSISDIFAKEGESGFRKREHEALMLVAHYGDMVVATGGGILTNEENIPILRSSGYCIFLDRPLDELVKEHTKADEDMRPLLVGGADDLTKLYYERIVQYRTNADIIIDAAKPDTLAKVMCYIREMKSGK